MMRICHEPGVTNSADVLTKGLSGPHHKKSFTRQVGLLHMYPKGGTSSAWEDWGFGACDAFPRGVSEV